ncbi:MAG: hypothetical protein WBB37_00420 [bacterium]
MYTTVIIGILISVIGVISVFLVARHWKWMPLVLLVILWYVPRQTVPGGVLDDFLILRWLSIFLIPLIVVVQLVRMAIRAQPVHLTNIILPLAIYIAFCIFSGIVNNISFVELVGNLVLYIRYPLLFIVLVNMDTEKNVMRVFFHLFIFLLAVQIPECLFRFFRYGIYGDYISWSLGPWGHFDLGVYAIYGAALVIATDAIKHIKWYHLVFVALLVAIALLGEIKALAFSIPIISMVTIYASFRQKKKRKYFLAIALPVFFVILAFISYHFWEKVHQFSGNTLALYFNKLSNFVHDPLVLVDPNKADLSSSRFLGSAFVWNYLKQDWRMLLFGAGPGSLLTGNLFGTPGKILEEVPYLNQIAVMLGDTGVIGLILYFWILISLGKAILKVNKTAQDVDVRVIAAAVIGMWLFYSVLGPFYDLMWRHDSPNYIFYFFTAFLYSYMRRRDKERL